jgi:S-adenosylmethionine:tRNA ribosyltransferase-isomerase
LLVVSARGNVSHHNRTDLPELLRPGDLVIANDAATLPASLSALHVPTSAAIEVRLAGRHSLSTTAPLRFTAVIFGPGNYLTPTEARALPPPIHAGDELLVGSLRARVGDTLGHPRLVSLEFEHEAHDVWEVLARHGRPIQYAYVPKPLSIWDTWTRIAAQPVAYEAPSAGFVLSWSMLRDFRSRGIRFATLTHAAGISSTGDPALDARLPFDEPYSIPASTAELITLTRRDRGRVIAVGTTVVRALEYAARATGRVIGGAGIASGRIGAATRLLVVDAIVSGMHEAGTSHYELLRAFQTSAALAQMSAAAEAHDYEGHEFGDAVLIMRSQVDESMRRVEVDTVAAISAADPCGTASDSTSIRSARA